MEYFEYLSLEILREITKNCYVDNLCNGCFTSKYPIGVPENIDKDRFESSKINFYKKR